MSENTHDWRCMLEALTRLGEYLTQPTRLVVIGSSVGMFYGQPGRMTEDIDVWNPKSTVDIADIQQACKKAGIVFDPREDEVAGPYPYLQMIKPGIVHVGKWCGEEHMFKSGNLTVVHPPAQNIIASKLVRCSDVDIEDIIFLMRRCNVDIDQVREAVETMGAIARETAADNIVLLEIHATTLANVAAFAQDQAETAKATRLDRPSTVPRTTPKRAGP